MDGHEDHRRIQNLFGAQSNVFVHPVLAGKSLLTAAKRQKKNFKKKVILIIMTINNCFQLILNCFSVIFIDFHTPESRPSSAWRAYPERKSLRDLAAQPLPPAPG